MGDLTDHHLVENLATAPADGDMPRNGLSGGFTEHGGFKLRS